VCLAAAALLLTPATTRRTGPAVALVSAAVLAPAVALAPWPHRAGPLLLAAGRPSASTEPLDRAGVSRYLHLGSDLVAELGAVLDTLGGE